MSPAEYGRQLGRNARPLTPEQVEKAARILAGVEIDADGDAHCGP